MKRSDMALGTSILGVLTAGTFWAAVELASYTLVRLSLVTLGIILGMAFWRALKRTIDNRPTRKISN
jgi:hypothetical protein